MLQLDRAVFESEFPKFSYNRLQLIQGRLQRPDGTATALAASSVNIIFKHFWTQLKLGMTMDQCWSVWLQTLEASQVPELVKWGEFTPHAKNWWPDTHGRPIHYNPETGLTEEYHNKYKENRLDTLYRRGQFKKLDAGMSLQQVRAQLQSNMRGSNACRRALEFKPYVPGKPVDKAKSEELLFLSTNRYEYNIFYDNDARIGLPDQIQMVLFTVTWVWTDKSRRVVDERFKKTVKNYKAFADRCLRHCEFVRLNKVPLDKYKFKQLQLMRDCTILVDYERKKVEE